MKAKTLYNRTKIRIKTPNFFWYIKSTPHPVIMCHPRKAKTLYSRTKIRIKTPNIFFIKKSN